MYETLVGGQMERLGLLCQWTIENVWFNLAEPTLKKNKKNAPFILKTLLSCVIITDASHVVCGFHVDVQMDVVKKIHGDIDSSHPFLVIGWFWFLT